MAAAKSGGRFLFPADSSVKLFDYNDQVTGGAMDPRVCRELELLGYDRNYSLKPSPSLTREEDYARGKPNPLASGRLTRDWSETMLRSETDQIQKFKYDGTLNADRLVAERVASVAENHGVPRTHIALAWLLQKDPVTDPIIGATKTSPELPVSGAWDWLNELLLHPDSIERVMTPVNAIDANMRFFPISAIDETCTFSTGSVRGDADRPFRFRPHWLAPFSYPDCQAPDSLLASRRASAHGALFRDVFF
ncbi:hypothetical protein AMS62_00040 [Bacillus sp. FJAT-18019]|nr:hypothetical protein AMS62_00040 [Bacillus sp. FJAT-18019]